MLSFGSGNTTESESKLGQKVGHLGRSPPLEQHVGCSGGGRTSWELG